MRTLASLCLLLIGCASAPPQHGYLLQKGSQAGIKKTFEPIAQDVATQLQASHPGQQAWHFVHSGADPFGRNLRAALRRAGHPVTGPKSARPEGALAMSYLVDRIKGTPLVRVQVEIDRLTFARVYLPRPDGAQPAGPWTTRLP